jgi:hypothetical protein
MTCGVIQLKKLSALPPIDFEGGSLIFDRQNGQFTFFASGAHRNLSCTVALHDVERICCCEIAPVDALSLFIHFRHIFFEAANRKLRLDPNFSSNIILTERDLV